MKPWAANFYNSKAWRNLRNAYFKSKHGICERCYGAGTEVHHKKHLTPDNINDSSVSLNWGNLELLCYKCHQDEHYRSKEPTVEGVMFDEYGNVVERTRMS